MSLNCNEINVILDELDLTGAFIQQIIQPGYDSLALYCYKNGKATTLLISLAPGVCRLHETARKVPKNDKPLRFMEFLKSRIKGCRINSVEQMGFERIIKMELGNSSERFYMFIRLWSAASNIIVTDSDYYILVVFFRRPKKDEVSGALFSLPEIDRDASLEEKLEKYPVRQFEEIENASEMSFNQKVEEYYSEHAATLSREAMLEQATKYYNTKHSKMEAALKKLEEKRQSFLSAEIWKHTGDLILAYSYLINENSPVLKCVDYDTDKEIEIPIDVKKSAAENANIYYEKYKKATSGLEALEHDISMAKKEILDLEAVYETVCKEQNPIRMQQLLRKQTKPKQQIAKKRPGLTYEVEGWQIFVGRTSDENDELLRKHVKGADLWFHTRDWPGGYVFVKARKNKTVPLDIMLMAGNLAVYNSKGRKAHTADLYYTQVKHLRRAKNGPKGTVLPSNEKNLTITLDDKILRKLDEYEL